MVNNFHKGTKAIHWGKDVHFNTVLEQLHMCMFPLPPPKRALTLTCTKYKPETDQVSKYESSIKLLEENVWKNILWSWLWTDVAQMIKEKNHKLGLIIIKNICLLKDTDKRRGKLVMQTVPAKIWQKVPVLKS